MSKYIQDTKEGKAISAWIILRNDGTEVANVRARYGSTGTVTINVFNYGKGNPDAEAEGFQCGRAGGYGYDKLTAALSGCSIDGHRLTNHCRESKPKPEGGWPIDSKPEAGWQFANQMPVDEHGNRAEDSSKAAGWVYQDCYRISGLDYLSAIGYRVLRAI